MNSNGYAIWMALWVALLRAVVFPVFDAVRRLLGLNLGSLPRAVRHLYLRLLVAGTGYTYASDLPIMSRKQRRAFYFCVPRRLRRHYVGLMGLRALPAVGGGATIVGTRSGLLWKHNPGGLPVIQDAKHFSGNIFFVDNSVPAAQRSDTAGYGLHPDRPFSTIDFAVGQCTANQGDAIFVLPGHSETLTAAAGLDADVADISIIGLGNGSNRPTIAMSTATTVDIDIDAANILFENLRITMIGVDAIAAGLDVNSAYFTMRACHIVHADATNQATLAVLTDANADYMLIEDCFFEGTDDAGTTTAIRVVGGDFVTIRDCRLVGAYSAAVGAIQMLTTAPRSIMIDRCDIENTTAASTACVVGVASATGTIRYCSLRNRTDANNAQITTPANMQLIQNYGVNNNGEAGILMGTASV